MLRRFLSAAVTVVSIAGALTLKIGSYDMAGAAQAQPGNAPVVPGQYIVVLKDSVGSPADTAADLARQNGAAVGHVYHAALKGFSAQIPAQRLQRVKNDPRVEYVEQDVVVEAFAQTLPTGVNRAEANVSSAIAGNGSGAVNIDVAIIDTGIQTNHSDLYVVGGKNCIGGNTKRYGDDNGHGTHVAGTVAARDNSIGVVGVAPGARLWAVKVLDRNGSGALSWVIAGVDFVTQNASKIEVANMSLGFQGTSSSLNTAISRSIAAGVTYVVAAGNSALDASGFSPANHPDVICVSAIADYNGVAGGGGGSGGYGDDDTFAAFSNYGAVVDIAAPGVNILSTYPGGYATMSGTSMASPHVAGAAALYKAANTLATPSAVRAALISAATPQSDLAGFSGDPDGYAEPLLNVSGF